SDACPIWPGLRLPAGPAPAGGCRSRAWALRDAAWALRRPGTEASPPARGGPRWPDRPRPAPLLAPSARGLSSDCGHNRFPTTNYPGSEPNLASATSPASTTSPIAFSIDRTVRSRYLQSSDLTGEVLCDRFSRAEHDRRKAKPMVAADQGS